MITSLLNRDFVFVFPTHPLSLFKGRLNELMSQLRMQTQVPGARADQQCMLDPMLLDEIRQVSSVSHAHTRSGRGGVEVNGGGV